MPDLEFLVKRLKLIFILQIFMILFAKEIYAQQNLTFGRYHSRAIFKKSNDPKCFAPVVILVPGSGANGPEEMIPASITSNSRDHSIFNAFSEGLHRGQVGTLSIGKPGVDFFKSWDKSKWFYNQTLFADLEWQDLIHNLKDAVALAKTLPCVNPNRIIVLGHSEGTQVAIDYAHQNPYDVSDFILVGFSGESLAATLDWQLFRRAIDAWLKPDVDINRDGFISRSEVELWPEFQWNWKPQQNLISFSEIEQALRADVNIQKEYKQFYSTPLWQKVFNRPAIYPEVAKLKQNVYVFTGALDVQTRPEESLRLQRECRRKNKTNCWIHIISGLGHAMSEPKGIRKQKLLDATLGPVSPKFIKLLESLAIQFTKSNQPSRIRFQ